MVYSVTCYGEVLISFYNREDAETARRLIERLTGSICMSTEDKISEFGFNGESSVAVLDFLDALADL